MWKPVKGYEGLYEVSDNGNVRGLAKITGKRQIPIHIMTSRISKFGYVMVSLCKNSKIFNASVHRLVAEAFIPNPDNLPCVNHIDGNKRNNTIQNLEWCSYSENNLHAYKTGLKDPMKCARHEKRKPRTDEEKKHISEGVKKKYSKKEGD